MLTDDYFIDYFVDFNDFTNLNSLKINKQFWNIIKNNNKYKCYLKFCMRYNGFSRDEKIIIACKKGYLDIVKWLYHVYENKKKFPLNEAIEKSSLNGHYNVVFWLSKLVESKQIENNKELFEKCCQKGFLNISKLLKNVFHIRDTDLNEALILSCEYGYLELAKWLYSLYNTYKQNDHINKAFELSCLNGHIGIAKWLLEDNEISLNTINDIFNKSCYNDNFRIAIWLHSLKPVKCENYTFIKCCKYGLLNMIQWILSKYQIDQDHINQAFIQCCYEKQLKTAEWLYSIYNINIDLFLKKGFMIPFFDSEVLDWMNDVSKAQK